MRYKGVSVSWINYTNPNNVNSDINYLAGDCKDPEVEKAINRTFQSYKTPLEIETYIKSAIDNVAKGFKY